MRRKRCDHEERGDSEGPKIERETVRKVARRVQVDPCRRKESSSLQDGSGLLADEEEDVGVDLVGQPVVIKVRM